MLRTNLNLQKDLTKVASDISEMAVTEGTRRVTGVTAISEKKISKFSAPDPEVFEEKPRRRFTAKYKLKILEETDNCFESGQIGSILRREGLYSSNLTLWRRQRNEGILQGINPKKRGRKKNKKNPLAEEVAKLQKEISRLRLKLKNAEIIIDAQKKISAFMEIAV